MDWSDYEVDGQLSIFDLTMEEFKITKPIRLIELFAGVGSQAMALRELGADFEHYRVVEFDKYAIASYNAIHGTDFSTMERFECCRKASRNDKRKWYKKWFALGSRKIAERSRELTTSIADGECATST